MNKNIWDLLTVKGRRALKFAEAEAAVWEHRYVGVEHLLLGLLEVQDGVAAKVLANHGLKYDQLYVAIDSRMKPNEDSWEDMEIQHSRPLKRAVVKALDVAHQMKRKRACTEHLLLGLLYEGDRVIVELLNHFGLDSAALIHFTDAYIQDRDSLPYTPIEALALGMDDDVVESEDDDVVMRDNVDEIFFPKADESAVMPELEDEIGRVSVPDEFALPELDKLEMDELLEHPQMFSADFVRDSLEERLLQSRDGSSSQLPREAITSKQHANFVIKAARDALDELIHMLRFTNVRNRYAIYHFVGESQIKIDAADALLNNRHAQLGKAVEQGHSLLPNELNELRSLGSYSANIAVEIVTQAVRFGNRKSMQRFERLLRDVNAASLHFAATNQAIEEYGRSLIRLQ